MIKLITVMTWCEVCLLEWKWYKDNYSDTLVPGWWMPQDLIDGKSLLVQVRSRPPMYKAQFTPAGLILGLRPANERQRYFVMTSLIGWAQT